LILLFLHLDYFTLGDDLVLLNVRFQEEMPQISHSELTDLKIIGQGGFGKVYRATHARFDNVVYKELNVDILGDRYAKIVLKYCI